MQAAKRRSSHAAAHVLRRSSHNKLSLGQAGPVLRAQRPFALQELSQIEAVNQGVERAFHLERVAASGYVQVWVPPRTGFPGCAEGLVVARHIYSLHRIFPTLLLGNQ